MEQLHAIAPLSSPSTSNATLPQWQLPLYFTLALLSLYWLLKKVRNASTSSYFGKLSRTENTQPLILNPSLVKNSIELLRFFTGRFTNILVAIFFPFECLLQ
jgi:hypothetical protein